MMNRMDRFCEAIMAFEGWNPGSRSYRNCNPGNLRKGKGQVGEEDGFAVFNSFADGWAALRWDVQCKVWGKTSTGLGPESTVEEFFQVYAPAADNNHPRTYAAFVCARVGSGLHLQSKLKELLNHDIARPMGVT